MIRGAWNRRGPSTSTNARTSANATSASNNVKPALVFTGSPGLDGNAARVPIDANFIFCPLARKPQHRSGRRSIGVKTHHRLPPGQLLVDPEDIDDDIARNCDNTAAIADERAAFSVERHHAIAAGQDCAEALASKQSCRFKHNGLELRAS